MGELTTILGGEDISITLRDGTSENIKVRELPIKKLDEFLRKIGDEDALVELYCDKETGWAANLTRESWEKVLEKGDEINLDFFTSRARKRLERHEKILPGFLEKIQKAQEKFLA